MSRILALCLTLLAATPLVALAGQTPTPPPPQPAAATRSQRKRSRPIYEEQIVVTASKVEQQLVNAPATVSVVTSDVIQSTPATNYAELLRSVPGRQHRADLGARLQHHDARRHLDALDLAARAGRRPEPLSRFLRVRRLGSAAAQSERDPADRSHPRAGVGGLGRQRAQRRRQLHLEDAARARRQQRDDQLRHLRPRASTATTPMPARRFRSTARTRAPSTIAGPTRSRPAATPRTPSRGRRASFPALNTPYPAFQNQGHDAAQVRYARGLRRARAALQARAWPAATRAPRASSTRASGPSTWTRGVGLGYGDDALFARRAEVQLLHQHPQRRCARRCSRSAPDGQPIPFHFHTKTYDFELGNANTIGTRQVISYGGNLRFNNFDLSIAPRGDNRTEVGRLRPGRDLPEPITSASTSARGSTSST